MIIDDESDHEDIDISVDTVLNSIVFDANGSGFKLRSLRCPHKKLVVICIRHFLDYIAKEYVEDLACIPADVLEEANVDIIVVSCGLPKFIQEFKALTGFDRVFSDPMHVLFTNLELHTGISYGKAAASSPHVKSSMLGGILESTMRALKYMDFQTDMSQQGGALIIKPDDTIAFFHRDCGPFDHARISRLLEKAGVKVYDFSRVHQVKNV